MDNPSDERLLDLYFAGDAAAFRAFYQRHAGRVFAYAQGKGLSAEAAEEVRQEAFLKLHRSIHRYESGRPALPWFFTIVHHCLVDAIRQSQALGRVKEHWEQPSPKADAEEDVTPALATLSAEQRQIVESRVFQDQSFKDIARATGKSEVALRKIYERARIRMKRFWEGGSHE